MKVKKTILSFISLAILSVFLIAGSGYMTISHSCKMCDVKTVAVYSALNPEGSTKACCSAGTDAAASGEENISSGCCELNSSEFSLPVYDITTFKGPIILFEYKHILFETSVSPSETSANIPVLFFNKHGGRFIVNANRQLLS